MNNELIIKQFGDLEVEFITNENGDVLFELYSTGSALGYNRTVTSKGKPYFQIRKDRIDKVMKNGSITGLYLGGKTYLTEEMLYDFMLEARTDKCKEFRKWVTSEVLPSIRKYGAYIDSNEESVDQNYIKYSYGQLKETFTKCHIEELREEYDNCVQWYKNEKFRLPYANNSKRRKGSKHTITETREIVMSKISVVLESRSLELKELGKFGLASEIDDVIKIIKDNIGELNNRVNGGKLAGATKKIKKLEEILN